MKKSNRVFKMIAVTVILALVINLLPNTYKKALAATGSGSGVETASGIIELDNGNGGKANIPYTQKLREVSNGYELTVTFDPKTTLESANKNRTLGDNGYFTADIAGDYMIEIVGGKGGEGANRLIDGSGDAGEPGHVYGVVHMNAGDTLFYSIGGNGQKTRNEIGGGNGGSGHGEDGSVEVGSGGGYTAVYFFESGDFDSYIDSDGKLVKKTIDESDRTTKVIMVAGGGGGGGADGEDISVIHKADGGNGGSIGGSMVTVEEGVIFPGENGKSSSGSDTSYVGKGGSNVPGKAVNSASAVIVGVVSSNPGQTWAEGGSGGTGNLRGGGGGAGYNGASGGVMKSYLDSGSVGGGGGGASFIKKGIKYADKDLINGEKDTLLTPDQIEKLQQTGSNNGGVFHITALNGDNALDFLSGISFDFEVSDYFDLKVSTNEIKNDGTTYTDSSISNISGASFIDSASRGRIIQIIYKFTRNSGFVGGNDVPLFKNNKITLGYSTSETVEIPIAENCAYVNVPLDGFKAFGKYLTYTATKEDGTSDEHYYCKDLYDEAQGIHATAFANAGTGNYYFIESVTSYIVKYNGENYDNPDFEISENITSTKSKLCTVSYTVVPKTGSKAKIGKKQVTEVYSASAAITYVAYSRYKINGDDITSDLKSLTYNDDGTYTLKYESTISYNQAPTETNPQPEKATSLTSGSTMYPGYYYVHIWGADGGKGCDSKNGASGGTGGKGDEINAIIKISESEGNYPTVSFTSGTGGVNGTRSTNSLHSFYPNYGGGGGSASFISLNNQNVIVAGGGGGGMPGSGKKDNGASGKAGSKNSDYDNNGMGESRNEVRNDYFDGISYIGNTGGRGGKSKTNNISGLCEIYDIDACTLPSGKGCENVSSVLAEAKELANDASTPSGYGKNGYVIIVPLCYDYYYYPNTTYSFTTNISDYFEIGDVTVSQKNGTVSVDSNNITKNDNVVSVKDFTLGFTNNVVYDSTYRAELSYEIDIPLTPIDGFLGGNDVPVIAEGTEMKISQGTGEGSYYDVAANVVTDYANVALNESAITTYLSSTDNPFKTYDETKSDTDPDELVYVFGYDGITYSKVCSTTAFASNYSDLQKAFVNITDVSEKDEFGNLITEVRPSEGTNYEFTFSVAPKSELPTMATVGDICDDYSATKYQKVEVMSSVKFDLNDIYVDGIDAIKGVSVNEPDLLWDIANTYDYECTLIPKKNYTLPETVKIAYKVYIGDGDDITDECDYDYLTGEIIVPYYILKTNSILIQAEAIAPDDKYTITYIYPNVDDNGNIDSEVNPITKVDRGPLREGETEATGYKAGDTIYDLTKADRLYEGASQIIPVNVVGYEFVWESTVDSYIADGKMPAKNLTFVGYYRPMEVKVTINYLDLAGTTMKDSEGKDVPAYTSLYKPDPNKDDVKSSLKYGDTISVESPSITGYKPVAEDGTTSMHIVSEKINTDILKKNGNELTTEDGRLVVEINVYYKSTFGELVVSFIGVDGKPAGEVDITLDVDDVYYIDLANNANTTLNSAADNDFSKNFNSRNPETGYDIYVNNSMTSTISGTMVAAGMTYTVKYIGKDVTVTFDSGVHVEGGENVADPSSITVQYGETLNYVKINNSERKYQDLPSVYRDGYEFVGWKIEGTNTLVTESTEVDFESLALVAVWESFDFTVTINFVGRYYEKIDQTTGKGTGKVMYVSKTLDTMKVTGSKSQKETIEMPVFTGYLIGSEYAELYDTTSKKYLKEIATTSDRSETIYYDLQIYKFTINYDDDDGVPVRLPYSAYVYYDETVYGMCPDPSVFGKMEDGTTDKYSSVSQKTVSGKMPADNWTVNVIYYKNTTTTAIVCVLVEWEPLDFVYTSGQWDPDTHTYGSGSFTWKDASETNGSLPEIKVTNSSESNVSIQATLSCNMISSYKEISATLSKTEMNLIPKKSGTSGTDLSSDTATLSLSGKMKSGLATDKKWTVGSVTVKIKRTSSPTAETT